MSAAYIHAEPFVCEPSNSKFRSIESSFFRQQGVQPSHHMEAPLTPCRKPATPVARRCRPGPCSPGSMERLCWRELDHMRRFLCLMATFLRSCSTMKTAVPPQSLSRSPCYLQSWRRAWLRWSLRRHPVPRPWNLISRRWRAC